MDAHTRKSSAERVFVVVVEAQSMAERRVVEGTGLRWSKKRVSRLLELSQSDRGMCTVAALGLVAEAAAERAEQSRQGSAEEV